MPVVSPPSSPSPSRSPLAADAVLGVTHPTLREVMADHWEHLMRWSPTWATTLGDHRFDDRLEARDRASRERRLAERRALLGRLAAIESAGLDANDRLSHALLYGRLEAEIGLESCKFDEWNVNAGGDSLLGELSYFVELHTVKTPQDAANLVARMRHGEGLVADTLENLAHGLGEGRVASAEKVRRAVAQLDAEFAKPASGWAMAQPGFAKHPEPETWPAGERDRLSAALRQVVESKIQPALLRLRDFLRDRVLPEARRDVEGLSGLPDGAECYRQAIRFHVGSWMEPELLHQIGLREIARTDREFAALGERVLGTTDLESTVARLRHDRTLYFNSGAEILSAANNALARAKSAQARFFATLPKADCLMREIPAYEAPYSTIAYYRPPHYDGSKPGEFFVNTYKPETRPRFELEALTWHESIPGHHLQIAIAQELGEIPLFRKLDGSTAFVEGWALYTERLADEMGLYSSDLDRVGMVSYDAWRASRLVVDTGLHALGWSRVQAENFLREHTALTELNISNEVDRYIGWPAQALAYKLGQLALFELRAEAKAALGARFDLTQFHAVVLSAGAVTLPVLRQRVRDWIGAA